MAKQPRRKHSGWEPLTYVREMLDSDGEVGQVWHNHLYVVIVSYNSDMTMAKLSIRRQNREAVDDWRHFQYIKNQLIGPENEALQIFPAESRLVDTSNHYWLWVFLDPTYRIPLGFQERLVVTSSSRNSKSRQRPFEPGLKPDNALTGEEMDALAERSGYVADVVGQLLKQQKTEQTS